MVAVSCGVLVVSSRHEILIGHATGSRRWDIFKGLPEPGESPLQTALRELREESGLEPVPASLVDLGMFEYLPAKSLHLFATPGDDLSIHALHCTSTFVDRFGQVRPEIDAFEWVPFEQVPQRCGKGMTQVLTARLSLPELAAAVYLRAGHVDR